MITFNNINYNKYFDHINKLKIILLVATGRSGSDFFQSLLDGHPQIIQFTGIWYFHNWWEKAVCKNNMNDLINEFIWHNGEEINHISKFNSEYNNIERWNELGDNKNESFYLDTNIFYNHMKNILQNRKLDSHNFFLAVNLSYALSLNVNILDTKIIFYHIHHIDKINEFSKDFENYDIISMIRDPNLIVSGMNNFRNYDEKIYYNSKFYFNNAKNSLWIRVIR